MMNIFSLSNIQIQTRHLQNTYTILDINLAQWNLSWIRYILSRRENLEKFHSYSETIRNMQINEESTTGPNDIYDVATQNEKFLYWPTICTLNCKKYFIKVYATPDHAASVKTHKVIQEF
jgi:hypothetical protein